MIVQRFRLTCQWTPLWLALPVASCLAGCGDADGDGDCDLADCQAFQACRSQAASGTPECEVMDFDRDGDIDLEDYYRLVNILQGPALASGTAEECGDGNDNDCDDLVDGADPDCGVVNLSYSLVTDWVGRNRSQFYVYEDADSGFNHGFPSGSFGVHVAIDATCIDDPDAADGCSDDPDRLDRDRGNVLRMTFPPLGFGDFAGLNIEEPENWGAQHRGIGYDLRGVTEVVFDVRTPTNTGMRMQFGVGGRVSSYYTFNRSDNYQTVRIELNSLRDPNTNAVSPPDLEIVHILFGIATNDVNTPLGGTLLLDNIRFEPVPTAQQSAHGLPHGNQTFGVLPRQAEAPGRVKIPPDQLLRNLSTTYESALAIIVLLDRGGPDDLTTAGWIADALVYAISHDNSGLPLAPAPDGSRGLRNGYKTGDLALHSDQGPGTGQAGEVRLAGFSASEALCGSSRYCLVLDGATGGNNAFAILALLRADHATGDPSYLEAARTIGRWIRGNLASETGYGGYFFGYPDGGAEKILIRSKSIENNADIFAAFTALAAVEADLGDATAAQEWQDAAN